MDGKHADTPPWWVSGRVSAENQSIDCENWLCTGGIFLWQLLSWSPVCSQESHPFLVSQKTIKTCQIRIESCCDSSYHPGIEGNIWRTPLKNRSRLRFPEYFPLNPSTDTILSQFPTGSLHIHHPRFKRSTDPWCIAVQRRGAVRSRRGLDQFEEEPQFQLLQSLVRPPCSSHSIVGPIRSDAWYSASHRKP